MQIVDNMFTEQEQPEPVLKTGETSVDGEMRDEGEPSTSEHDTESFPPRSEEEERDANGKAEALKAEGNKLYAQGNMDDALAQYREALALRPSDKKLLSVLHANAGACLLKLAEYEDCVVQCSAALEHDPGYVKALQRRGEAYEKQDKLEEALADYSKVLELKPDDRELRKRVLAIQPIVEERRERLKEEMMGKLKDIGNSVLGYFGLSLDNFKTVKDPATGSYSISFQQ